MDEDTKSLVFWNRVWLTLFVALALGWGAIAATKHASSMTSEVRTHWSGDTLRFFTLRGGVVISHLHSPSGEQMLEARLPTPLYILDSGPVQVEPATWKSLVWRDGAGEVHPAPAPGGRVNGLYTRLEWTVDRDRE